MIQVIAKGMLTTVQDCGRKGFQKLGVPVCGAMDSRSLAEANLLAGNAIGEGCLEVTGLGPSLEFETGNVFAIAGADFSPTLNGVAIETGRAYSAGPGSVLTLQGAKTGFRCYIAFAGGLDVPVVLGSKSTYLGGGFGGWQGRALEKGDRLPFANPITWLTQMEGRHIAPHPATRVLRVVLGPQEDTFSAAGQDAFLSGEYTISPQSDRMGYRTKGPSISFAEGKRGDILSDGIVKGSVQVPDGLPIIMMADAQTVGGYAKLATVASVDLPVLAQCRPGEAVTFAAIGVEEAQKLYRAEQRRLRALEDALSRWRPS